MRLAALTKTHANISLVMVAEPRGVDVRGVITESRDYAVLRVHSDTKLSDFAAGPNFLGGQQE